MPEYLVIFKKWSEGDTVPIKHYKSDEDAEQKQGDPEQVIDLETWQRYASPVWFDIKRTDVLNARIARDDKDEKHICPLQLEVIRRAIKLWSNPGEIVFSPFGGIGSEPYIALEQKRRAIAAELKPSYFAQMVANCKEISSASQQLSLFGDGD
jgi:DNA modification methylase